MSVLNGTILRTPVVGKRVKLFKKQNDVETYVILDTTIDDERVDKDREVMRDDGSKQELTINELEGDMEGSRTEEE